MNDKIQKLFEQALENFKAENKYVTIVVPDPLQRDFVEKFAELIVRECIDNVEVWEKDNRNHISYLMKQHFGVKE